MNVFAGFDGHSGGRTALHVMGITPTKYYASEVDKYAMQASAAVFPDIIQMGDITKWREWDINWSTIDLFIGGSPCQGFSMAGKMAGTAAILNGEKVVVDTREKYLELKEAGAEFLSQSYLFWEYILLLDHVKVVNPKVKFFLENVKMKKEFLDLISSAIGVDPVFINSKTLSPHSRPRIYWANWFFNTPSQGTQKLIDIIEPLVDSKYFLSEKLLNGFNNSKSVFKDRFKPHTKDSIFSYCLTSRYHKMGKTDPYFRCQDGRIRKLTPRECGRLQTIPEDILDTLLSAGISRTYEQNFKESKKCENAKLKIANSLLQVEKLNCVINTTLDLFDLGQLKNQERLLIKASVAQSQVAKEIAKPQSNCVLSTTSNGTGGTLQTQNHAQFALKVSAQGGVECVLSMQHPKQDTVTKTRLILTNEENSSLTGIKTLNIIKIQTVDGLIGLSLKKLQEENSEKERLSIILMAINLITVKAIFTYANLTQITYANIDSLSQSQCNSLEVDISSLKMQSIKPISNSNLYKMFGNGWTIDVIVHIFSTMELPLQVFARQLELFKE